MRRQSCLFYLILILCVGCSKHPIVNPEATIQEWVIADDAPHLAKQHLYIMPKQPWEDAEVVYFAHDTLALAKIIQYAIDCDLDTIAYQSDTEMDLDEVNEILSMLNPFDLSLVQEDITYTNGEGKTLYCAHHIQIRYLDSRVQQSREAAQKRIEAIIHEHMSTEEKIVAIHDDIISHCIYADISQDQDVSDRSFYHPSGVLLDGSGVCAGYSRAFLLMARYAGIPALYVASSEMNHGWNYVYDGQAWRFIDLTWDDPLPDQGVDIDSTYLYMDEATFLNDGVHVLHDAQYKQIQQIATDFFTCAP